MPYHSRKQQIYHQEADVNINTDSKEKVQMIPDELCQFNNPNMYIYSLHADLAEKRKDKVTPYMIINLSSTEHL